MQPIESAAIEAASARIASWIRVTPTLDIEAGGLAVDPVTLKLECFQHTGSFKPRGMFNRLLTASVPPVGVVAASGGNAGLAVAYAARALGHLATVFVPETAPQVKVARLGQYGASVQRVGSTYSEALAASVHHATTTGALFVHAYDQPEVVAGQGTLARELGEVDTVLVAVGGGGLIAGVAGWYAGRVRVIAVEPIACPTYAAALDAGEPVDVAVGGVAGDSLGASRIGDLCWAARHWITASVLVTEDAIVRTQRRLWETCRVIAEPGGATALAALASGEYKPESGERVVAVVCGANTDPAMGVT